VLGQSGGGVTRVPFVIRRGRAISVGEAEDTQESALARPHAVVAYDPDYCGPYEPSPVGPSVYNPSNATHEVLRRHFVDPDGRIPDDPALDFDALLALFQSA
jgi:hypothetical protein